MKKYKLSFFLLLICFSFGYAQNVPTLTTEALESFSFKGDLLDVDLTRYWKLHEKYHINGDDRAEMSNENKVFYKKMEQLIESGKLDPEFPPWAVQGPGCSWYCGARYETDVSSSLPPSGANRYDKERIFDDDIRTAWVEGAKGYGIGEYIEFTFPYGAPRAKTCYVANGYNKNEQTWRNNSRVKTFNIYEDDKLMAVVKLKDTRDLQHFELPHYIPNRPDVYNHTDDTDVEAKEDVKLKFVITEVYKGDRYDDTAISEFFFSGTDVHCLAKGTLISMADGSNKAIENIKKGDMVISFNPETKEWQKSKVTLLHSTKHKHMLNLATASGKRITATSDHPFLGADGWYSHDPMKTKQYKRYGSASVEKYVKGSSVYELKEGEAQLTTIIKIEAIEESTMTYTLELENNDTFLANGLIVGQE